MRAAREATKPVNKKSATLVTSALPRKRRFSGALVFVVETVSFRWPTFCLRLLGSLLLVGLATFACFEVFRVNQTTAGFVYLLCVLMIGAAWGLLEAIAASVAAMLFFNYYFLPPIRTFTISDSRNWVALFTFLFVSITASQLADRAKRRAGAIEAQQAEMEKLYSLGRAILLIEPGHSPARIITHQIARIFGFPAFALFDRSSGSIYHSGPENMPDINERLKEAATRGSRFVDKDLRVTVVPIQLGGQPVGSMAIREAALSDTALQSLLNLVAVGLEKARTQEASTRAEAARQSQELKSTLLDAIAHDFKTPLTSIKAASTSLLSSSPPLPAEKQELITIIDEEAGRLSRLVTEAIQMAWIEAGQLKLKRVATPVEKWVEETLRQLRPMTEGRKINLELPKHLPLVDMDFELMVLALRQILDNALKYSAAGAEITLNAKATEGRLELNVLDRGPGVAQEEREKIFERFYRGRSNRGRVTGSGIGLAIAREIVKAHGGEIEVKDNPAGGSIFSIVLPRTVEGKLQ
jgi:two-component system sensor histidine kinase KdpD